MSGGGKCKEAEWDNTRTRTGTWMSVLAPYENPVKCPWNMPEGASWQGWKQSRASTLFISFFVILICIGSRRVFHTEHCIKKKQTIYTTLVSLRIMQPCGTIGGLDYYRRIDRPFIQISIILFYGKCNGVKIIAQCGMIILKLNWFMQEETLLAQSTSKIVYPQTFPHVTGFINSLQLSEIFLDNFTRYIGMKGNIDLQVLHEKADCHQLSSASGEYAQRGGKKTGESSVRNHFMSIGDNKLSRCLIIIGHAPE